jgi:hypothetical protein
MLVYREAAESIKALTWTDPRNAGRWRDLSIILERIGRVQEAQGDLPGALKSYQAAQGIAQTLAPVDASNTQWKRDLSSSINRIGDVQRAGGDIAAAPKSY